MKSLLIFALLISMIACKENQVSEHITVVLTDTTTKPEINHSIPKSVKPSTSVNTDTLEVRLDTLKHTIVLSENKINNIDLPFPLKDMTATLDSLFEGCKVTKGIGKQDGPDYPFYSINCNEEQLISFAMHDEDTLVSNSIYILDSIIEDQYKLRVGDDISKIKEKRGKGIIGFDPYHYHMYYYYKDSKISYELTGNLRPFAVDSIDIIEITEADIAGWTIEYIIWRQ